MESTCSRMFTGWLEHHHLCLAFTTYQGKPRYATACGISDVVEGWRHQRAGGGCVIDVQDDQSCMARVGWPYPTIRGYWGTIMNY